MPKKPPDSLTLLYPKVTTCLVASQLIVGNAETQCLSCSCSPIHAASFAETVNRQGRAKSPRIAVRLHKVTA